MGWSTIDLPFSNFGCVGWCNFLISKAQRSRRAQPVAESYGALKSEVGKLTKAKTGSFSISGLQERVTGEDRGEGEINFEISKGWGSGKWSFAISYVEWSRSSFLGAFVLLI